MHLVDVLRDKTESRRVFYANILSDDSARQIISCRCHLPLRMSFIHYNSITWGWQVATATDASMENVRKLQRTFSFTSLHEAFMRESVKIPFYCHIDSLNPQLFPVCFIYLVYRNPSKESVACRQSSSRVELCRNLKKPFDVYLADLFSFAYEGSRVPPFSLTCFPENIGKNIWKHVLVRPVGERRTLSIFAQSSFTLPKLSEPQSIEDE